jgi:ribosomal-protein-alanine N-acetyltransferase
VDRFPILNTERLLLREFREADAQAVFDIYSQERAVRYLNSDIMYSLAEAAEKVDIRMDMFKNRRGIRWAITLADQQDAVIGSCGFYDLNRHWFSCEVGFEIHPRYWRRGLMTEALEAAIAFAYSDRFFFQMNRIQALTYLNNQASIGLLRKLGFREEGIRREYGYWKDRFHDLRCFSLLRREWAA